MMRKRNSVDIVGAALVTALGLLGGCGGIASLSGSADGGASSGEGGAGTKPVAGSPTCASPPCSVSTSTSTTSAPPSPTTCTAHPCVDPKPVIVANVDTGYDTCEGGALRRRAIVDCPFRLPPAAQNCPPVSDAGVVPGACTKDSDCTDHPYGWCGPSNVILVGPPDPTCYCSYGCARDSDCPSAPSSTCVCADPMGYCLPGASCSSGNDCQPGCDCVETFSAGFRCQTPRDTCLIKADCADGGGCCEPVLPVSEGTPLSCGQCGGA